MLNTRDKFSNYNKMKNEAEKIDKPQGNGVLPCVSNSLPTTDELFTLLEKLHKNCLYKLTPSDDRCTHLPFELFDEVETMLSRRQ